MNWIPGVSQIKSVFQLACGDVDGAAQTQKDFFQECPIVSQVTSTAQLLTGDVDGAVETQKKCGNMLLRTADSIPIVGHTKGVVHQACGDTKSARQAFKSANRTTAAMGGGVLGFLTAGPPGSIVGGIAGAAAMDTKHTFVDDSQCHPSGYYAAIDNILKNPTPGAFFDTLMMPVGDGLAGYNGGQLVAEITASPGAGASPPPPSNGGGGPPGADALAKASILESKANTLLEAAETGKMNMPNGEYLGMAREAQGLWRQAQDLKGTNPIIDLKVAPTAGGGGGGGHGVVITGGNNGTETDAVKTPEILKVEFFSIMETDALALVGTSKSTTELTYAILQWDLDTIKTLLKELELEMLFPKFSKAEITLLRVMALATEAGAFKGVGSELFAEVIKKKGQKGKQAIKECFSLTVEDMRRAEANQQKDKKHKRGEHVINTSAMAVHRDILDMFLARPEIDADKLRSKMRASLKIQKDRDHYFSQLVKRDIEDILIVHFSAEETYVDTNAFVYGIFIDILKQLAVEYMVQVYIGVPSGSKRPLQEMCRQINNYKLYVDELALQAWRMRGAKNMQIYERARRAVYEMFDGLQDRVQTWAYEFINVKPL